MFEAQAFEFPFVESLPKREKSRVEKAIDLMREMSELQKREGALVPAILAAKILNVSHQRLYELSELGRVRTIEFHGHRYITEKDLVEFAKMERKAGRPVKAPTMKDCLAMAKEYVRKK